MKSFDMIFFLKESTDLLCISIVGSAFILNPKLLKNCWKKRKNFFEFYLYGVKYLNSFRSLLV